MNQEDVRAVAIMAAVLEAGDRAGKGEGNSARMDAGYYAKRARKLFDAAQQATEDTRAVK